MSHDHRNETSLINKKLLKYFLVTSVKFSWFSNTHQPPPLYGFQPILSVDMVFVMQDGSVVLSLSLNTRPLDFWSNLMFEVALFILGRGSSQIVIQQ